MPENTNEVPALDDLNGDDIEIDVGDPVNPDHDIDMDKAATDE